ncbi:preprotein translocase subunit YajC [Halorhodospira abdelmalekii]|uniref:preprotein translocase subunit YajC n=1 Tax=Halorhodospira abdelmalekii TaxID=421629 RepID=UPI001905A94E|nr:preprotein translocase subunit YajC [Halorhodospira abdelmalekii]MBK1735906.1 preprotein translocase subunit YajC [Halorhodospira abdelmalekii]
MLLDFVIAPAYAQQDSPGTGDLVFFLVFTVLLVAIFYFLLIRPQRKRMKQHQEMVENLQVGDEVMTGGGELGRIKQLGEQFVRVEVSEGVEWTIKRDMIGEVLSEGTLAEARSGVEETTTQSGGKNA